MTFIDDTSTMRHVLLRVKGKMLPPFRRNKIATLASSVRARCLQCVCAVFDVQFRVSERGMLKKKRSSRYLLRLPFETTP